MGEILNRAVGAEPPTVAMQYEQEQLRLLVSLCRELQREAGKRPFFLSIRTAAEQVGVSPSHAATWLNGLVIDGNTVRHDYCLMRSWGQWMGAGFS